MAVVSFLILMCVALSSPTTGLRLPLLEDPDIVLVSCLRGWTVSEDRCYKLFTTPKTWHQAQADCRNRASNLVSVRNSDDLHIVQTIRGLPGRNGVWVGGTDAVTGQWQWSDDEPFSWTFWAQRQPDNLREEDCMSVGIGGAEYDEKCDKRLPYICYSNI